MIQWNTSTATANSEAVGGIQGAAPPAVKLRSGRMAKLAEGPYHCEFNRRWFVLYETDQCRLSLEWPDMTYFPSGHEAHVSDAIDLSPEVPASE